MSFIDHHPEGIAFRIHVQPRSSRDAIVGMHGDALKVKLQAPPVEGAANRMCVQYLAGVLGVKKSALQILSGKTSRNKRLLLRFPAGTLSEVEKERLRERVASLADRQKTA